MIILLIISAFIGYFVYRKYSTQSLNSSAVKGREGELAAEKYLHKLFAKHGISDYFILRNIIIAYSEDWSTEIDLLVLTRKGVIVVESKNYKGLIRGKEKEKNWEQELGFSEKKTYIFYSPIRQNQHHINILKRYIPLPLYSLILFGSQASVQVDYTPTDKLRIHTIGMEDDHWFAEYLQQPDILSSKSLNNLQHFIKKEICSDMTPQQHINQLKKRKKG